VKAAFLVLLVAGCAVGNPEYPIGWDPLIPPKVGDCRVLQGIYADRGRTRDGLARSLTRELFGFREEWASATRVQFELPIDDVLTVTVWAGSEKLLARDLHVSEGEFTCDAGVLVVRDKRWVAEDLLAGHENVALELHPADGYLVARIREFTFALGFLLVPFVADATHWYRFPRITN
jgi:hypothetical protein